MSTEVYKRTLGLNFLKMTRRNKSTGPTPRGKELSNTIQESKEVMDSGLQQLFSETREDEIEKLTKEQEMEMKNQEKQRPQFPGA